MPLTKQIGDRVGPYTLTKVLGQGGAGQVFAARWEPDEEQRAAAPPEHPREVALKLLRAAHAGSELLFHRFIREIDVAQRIHHPHLIQHYDSGLADDVLYYAMELAPSGSLRAVLGRRGALPWRDAAESAMHIADALGALHDAGVTHRDLKPDNVFLSESGLLKLGDFGLAYNPDQRQLTLGGQTVGSVRYMAPEQVRARRDLDGRCDLYALGCVLMEMLAGRPPFTSTEPTEVFFQHAEVAPPKTREIAPGTPDALCDLVDRLLRKAKEDRPPTAQSVRDALAAILASDDGSIGSLETLLQGAPAAIEPAPIDDETDSGSLTGADGLSGNELTGAEYEDDFDEFEAERDRAALRESGTDLSRRLVDGGGPARPTISSSRAIGLIVAALLVAAALVFATTSTEEPTDAAPSSSDEGR